MSTDRLQCRPAVNHFISLSTAQSTRTALPTGYGWDWLWPQFYAGVNFHEIWKVLSSAKLIAFVCREKCPSIATSPSLPSIPYPPALPASRFWYSALMWFHELLLSRGSVAGQHPSNSRILSALTWLTREVQHAALCCTSTVSCTEVVCAQARACDGLKREISHSFQTGVLLLL